MADFNEYPANLSVKDALIVRQVAEPDHAVVPYTGEDLSRPRLGPANPFRDETDPTSTAVGVKRKNVLTGTAAETYISEHTFRAKHRAIERGGGPAREALGSTAKKAAAAKLRQQREGKGSATVADGDGAYVGPWARYKKQEYEEVNEEELGSDEEFEIVEEEEEDEEEVVESGTVVKAPTKNLARRKEVEELGEETTTFHGTEEFDYLGRTYMHVPQDLDISLTKDVGSVTNFIPKKHMHTWRHHAGKPVTALQLFPKSSHLGLSGSTDGTIKIFDVYRNRELLRTYAGHSKAITDLSFNRDGTKFLSGAFDRWIKLWDTETGQCVNRFNTGKTPHVIKFNPSVDQGHEFLAGLSDNRIVQYDSRAGEEPVQEYDHHLGAINTLEFVDESRRFMSTSDDRSLRVWEYGIPVEIKTIRYLSLLPLCTNTDQMLTPSTANPTCSPSPNPLNTPRANTSSTNAPTTLSSPTLRLPTNSARTARSPGGATTPPAPASGSSAVPTASSSLREILPDMSASGTGRRARCTTRSMPIPAAERSTVWFGRSRRRVRCLRRGRRVKLGCGIRHCPVVGIRDNDDDKKSKSGVF